jgi:heat shock protein HslJ
MNAHTRDGNAQPISDVRPSTMAAATWEDDMRIDGILAVLAALAVLVLSACAGAAGPTAAGVEDGDGSTSPAGSWVLADARPAIQVPGDARITLSVEPDGDAWQVGGTSACNSYGGTVATDGDRWQSEGFGMTEMACDVPRMDAEAAYLDALMAVDTWARPSADELVLTGPGVELRFTVLAPVPTADLTGTTWLLDGLTVGTGPDGTVSSTVAEADEATLYLDTDGTMTASTGCRTFSGEWIETGDEVLLTTFGERDDSPNTADDGTTTCSAAVVAQEDHVLSVLGDGFRGEVEGDRLTLISRDGLGLTYRATDGDPDQGG